VTFKDVIGNDAFVYNKVVVLTDSFARNGRLSPEEKLNNQIVEDSHACSLNKAKNVFMHFSFVQLQVNKKKNKQKEKPIELLRNATLMKKLRENFVFK